MGAQGTSSPSAQPGRPLGGRHPPAHRGSPPYRSSRSVGRGGAAAGARPPRSRFTDPDQSKGVLSSKRLDRRGSRSQHCQVGPLTGRGRAAPPIHGGPRHRSRRRLLPGPSRHLWSKAAAPRARWLSVSSAEAVRLRQPF
ncbi:hypothetical protein NDU88_000001 [Pleurodeles waltl]|uniref:Uncharacterized protein n=1 Tax=Pleurodeles waltl TaxID=8319 RepID=A0AAV7V769_PLEWA|nr:hypothetical protein NDU88_000001 [Pleurodeles waltl]